MLSLKTSRAINALRALSESSSHTSASKIATRYGFSIDSTERLCSKLAHGGLVRSAHGRYGGFVLQRDLREIRIRDVEAVVDESESRVRCPIGTAHCTPEHPCALRARLEQARDLTLAELGDAA